MQDLPFPRVYNVQAPGAGANIPTNLFNRMAHSLQKREHIARPMNNCHNLDRFPVRPVDQVITDRPKQYRPALRQILPFVPDVGCTSDQPAQIRPTSSGQIEDSPAASSSRESPLDQPGRSVKECTESLHFAADGLGARTSNELSHECLAIHAFTSIER